MEKPLDLSVRDVAALLKVAEKTIYRWIKLGSIPAFKVQEQYRFHRAEILEWATSKRIGVMPDIYECQDNGVEKLRLSDALRAGGIFYRIAGSDKQSVLRSVVETMHLPDRVDREQFLKALVAREQLASTAIGNGIAIPHVRNPIILHVDRPQVTLAFPERPVDFGALDGKPVHCLFTVISPTIKAHLVLLSRLAFVLQDRGFSDLLRSQGMREEIMTVLERVENAVESRKAGPAEPAR